MNLLALTLLLLAVFALSMGGSYLQHRYYLRVVNDLARQFKDRRYVLASGRHKGRLRGAVAVLVVHREQPDQVERAVVMSGSTMFAKFRDRSQIHGHITPESLAQESKAVRMAVLDALTRGHAAAAGGPAAAAEQPINGDDQGKETAIHA